MSEWYCFQCKEKMEEKDVEVSYLEIVRFLPGLKCPRCGTAYFTEDMVEDTLRPGEEELESKLG